MLTISALAERTGFSPSTLRYYEQVGVIAPPLRAPSGYRNYDEQSVERLQFVARAKSLGLPLEGIKELLVAWDGGSCASVRGGLRSTVEAKLQETNERVAELTAFAGQFQGAVQDLIGPAPAGRCGPDCGCLSAGTHELAGPVDLELTRRVPVACTLTGPSQQQRLDEWSELIRSASSRTNLPDGVRLVFPSDGTLLARLGELILAEQQCCAFLDFVLAFGDGSLTLTVTTDAEGEGDSTGAAVVHAMFGAA